MEFFTKPMSDCKGSEVVVNYVYDSQTVVWSCYAERNCCCGPHKPGDICQTGALLHHQTRASVATLRTRVYCTTNYRTKSVLL